MLFFQDFTWEEFGEFPLEAFVGFSAYGLGSRLEAVFFFCEEKEFHVTD